ncbi:transcriptional regulator, MarR family [Albimonas pacifica]|uniref:Transcriptional regulator, MarR family n=2 Tax=Albimonas pacifica TaxID=1114924 RepID=A0A1I3F6L8_9RHOB|nr:transcriptional regulator, MarR family [Albimonas pacifica]
MSSADTPSRARGASPGPQGARPPAARMRGSGLNRGDQLLFLTDAQLRQGVELMFFAYRDMIADADRVLETRGYGRAHHRCLHFVWRRPGMSVSELLDTLKVTKQSLNRVLRQLVEDGMIDSKVGPSDRRQRLLTATPEGEALVRSLSDAQNARMRRVFMEAGAEAVQGFKTVLADMIDEDSRESVLALVNDQPGA